MPQTATITIIITLLFAALLFKKYFMGQSKSFTEIIITFQLKVNVCKLVGIHLALIPFLMVLKKLTQFILGEDR